MGERRVALVSRRPHAQAGGLSVGAVVGVALLAVLVLLSVRVFFFDFYRIPSASMSPTVPQGSYVVVSKSGFGDYSLLGMPISQGATTAVLERGELVVFKQPENPEVRYLSRIIGLPGEHVLFKDRRLYIGDEPVPTEELGVEGEWLRVTENLDGREATVQYQPARPSVGLDTVVPPDHYLTLGDNRDNARDGRYIGTVPKTNLSGRVIKIFD
jgi:signal peptidase I